MPKAMTLTRRESLMGVLKKVCIDPVMSQAYAEAETRLRKNTKFVQIEKALAAVQKIKEKLDVTEAKLERELVEVTSDICDEYDLSTPSINAYITNDFPDLNIEHEGDEVVAVFKDRYSKAKLKLREKVDTNATEAQRVVAQAMDNAELCVTEVELIELIRETKEKIAALPSEPKGKKKKKK